jgi:ABC-2 type transport system permease protein/capsular polysaccharide transport system permease protein
MLSSQSTSTGSLLQSSSWKVNRRVLGALLFRELLTRYGRNNLGFLWLFLEPMLFTLAITAFWTATRSIHGSVIPIAAFAITGYSSVLVWRNMAGRCINAFKTNKSLLFHRQVMIVDVYMARITLEIFAVSTSFATLSIILYAFGLVPVPENILEVLGGWFLTIWFGAALALTVGGLSEKFEVVARLWSPFQFILFAFSGVGFLVDTLPQSMANIVLWLPMVNALELMRDGWFGSLFHAHYDIAQIAVTSLVLTFVGLSLVRQVGLDASEEE